MGHDVCVAVRQLKGTFLQGLLQRDSDPKASRVKREQLVMSNTRGLVYVVDDDASVREGVASLVRSFGLEAKGLASGQEFLAIPRPEIPSCLVLDVQLPGLSGLDVQQEIVRSGVNLLIIFLTGYGDIPMKETNCELSELAK
jgi:CheY-like chemotaxis protein